MRQKSGTPKATAERVVKDIRRKTRKHHSAEEKIRIVLEGLRGQRLYLLVAEAGDIPRAGAALVDRLWAAGLGRIVASVAGTALERCPVDACVWQPERLDFAAGAMGPH